ncbi:hypothetical protein DSAG12_02968 [Promethearchaeum syntrophicum]|uniref:Uncharacterized protein n=1 Tax=Promethearchaeum syntrophicum TaxID=2594042 RepID=A0A5B9DEG1_9ARCH|nr:hypothetical protein [Candidatus Prometheoarchaeum syntrophicum]QEE17136.1 hypothetical protein DSAG12_02968 [Candidatus Prometheoarchaeum syntrophicum]
MAKNLAPLLLRGDILIDGEGDVFLKLLDKTSVKDLDFVYYNEIFEHLSSSRSREDGKIAENNAKSALKIISNSLDLALLGIYLTQDITHPSHIYGGSNYIEKFLHIMDAYIHYNIPGQRERNAIFMDYNRIRRLLEIIEDPGIAMIRENEMSCIEDLLKRCIDNQFDQRQKGFIELIKSKTSGISALYDNLIDDKNYGGHIYSQYTNDFKTSGKTLSFMSKLSASDIEWEFMSQMHAKTYIGFLQKDITMVFTQLGNDFTFVGGSTSELLSIISQTMFRRQIPGTDKFELIYLPPGQITNVDGNLISPRTLMINSQVLLPLMNNLGHFFQVDYSKNFAAKRTNSPQIDEDAGRVVYIGYMGMPSTSYVIDKLEKIEDIQAQGAAFISIMGDGNIRAKFESVLASSRFSGMGTVLINKKPFDYLEEISNNPDTYHLSYEHIIDDITRIAAGLSAQNPIISQLALNSKYNAEIAKAFGKSVDAQRQVTINSIMAMWWNNFRHSKAPRDPSQPIGNMFKAQSKMLKFFLKSIRNYYRPIDPNYIPPWVILNGWKTEWESYFN